MPPAQPPPQHRTYMQRPTHYIQHTTSHNQHHINRLRHVRTAARHHHDSKPIIHATSAPPNTYKQTHMLTPHTHADIICMHISTPRYKHTTSYYSTTTSNTIIDDDAPTTNHHHQHLYIHAAAHPLHTAHDQSQPTPHQQAPSRTPCSPTPP